MSSLFSSANHVLHSTLKRVMLRENVMQYRDYEQEFEGVSQVEYNRTSRQVMTVMAHTGWCDKFGTASLYTRKNVIRSIQAGVKFTMMRPGHAGGWSQGSRISVVVINGVEYLKTGTDMEEADCLEFITDPLTQN